ncbi:sensor histidine kinase [Patiriisocius hiemis]|uniref:histidine kinase n=1 Tax=Patiriisocius hiemis TaxID=3075604 RepID=A0ABU2YAM9_9FLAO|nr:PAS domain-containing sensor histidine kinase [Constantimarinum sp. W242]MDT0554906.1 PAS domain-containing sensor histidine kinase [Constantimarinum sp. W242]
MGRHYLQEELYDLIKKDESIFEFLQNSALDGLWYWDLEKPENEWMNDRLWEVLGYNPVEMPHKAAAWQEIINQEDLALAIDNFNKHCEDPNHKYDQNVRYQHKDGHTVWVRCRGIAIRNKDGVPIRMLGAHTDITELKSIEEEMRSSLMVSEDQNNRLKNFAHIVSHNLRSHSSNFGMLLDLYIFENPEKGGNELISSLKRASENLKQTIEHLNQVVLINTTVEENLTVVNLSKAIQSALTNISSMLKTTGTKLINETDQGLEIIGIDAYIDSILLNFLTNAIKYRNKKVDSYVKISTKKKKKFVELSIEDNGMGIDLKKNRRKLFGMYKTFHGNKDAQGIGLFISKNQIEAIGGKVDVKSTPEEGTLFKIYFKLA